MGLARDKANFYSMLASMAQAGLGLRQCFGLSSFPYRLRPAARSICELLDAGVPLPEAMHRQSVFTAFECNLVSVGVASGTLDATFSTLSQWFTDSHQFRSQIISALAHPMLTYFVAGPLLGVVDYFATGLSLTTTIIRCIAWWLAPIAIWFLLKFLGRLLSSLPLFSFLIESLPVLGPLLHSLESSRFYRAFGLSLRAGIGMVNSIELASGCVKGSVTRTKFDRVKRDIQENGMPFTVALKEVASLRDRTSSILPLLATGEQSGSLAESCLRIADMASEDARTTLRRIAGVAPGVAFLPLAFYIGYRVISFYAGHIGQINTLTE